MKRSIRDIVRAEEWERRRRRYTARVESPEGFPAPWPGHALIDRSGIMIRLRLWPCTPDNGNLRGAH